MNKKRVYTQYYTGGLVPLEDQSSFQSGTEGPTLTAAQAMALRDRRREVSIQLPPGETDERLHIDRGAVPLTDLIASDLPCPFRHSPDFKSALLAMMALEQENLAA